MSSKGRKALKQGSLVGCPEPHPGQILMRVVALRGSNLIEVEDADKQKTLCMLPARFHKSIWIKRAKLLAPWPRSCTMSTFGELRKTSFWSPSFDVTEKATKSPSQEDCSKSKQTSDAASFSNNAAREDEEEEAEDGDEDDSDQD
ncbi:hypothetical protein R1sor_026015 [Riccia sorocarpa]|uniref:S1-like domain-containing protein n=1 Tax=Riccia sorocarpa TaxID=122646 RepID=A0ABD3GA77_9MARC